MSLFRKKSISAMANQQTGLKRVLGTWDLIF